MRTFGCLVRWSLALFALVRADTNSSCGDECISQLRTNLPRYGCDTSDTACLCRNTILMPELRACTIEICHEPQAWDDAFTYIDNLCASVGVETNVGYYPSSSSSSSSSLVSLSTSSRASGSSTSRPSWATPSVVNPGGPINTTLSSSLSSSSSSTSSTTSSSLSSWSSTNTDTYQTGDDAPTTISAPSMSETSSSETVTPLAIPTAPTGSSLRHSSSRTSSRTSSTAGGTIPTALAGIGWVAIVAGAAAVL
ncbi:hypothetical protein M231_04418 [Tremella mesenterica]|uniref:CFEM domain-containing protein n=1 Tax=Tremella mesenterica TaxID=5217 RepID=A0A4Q1BKN2_TREME|nr:uncharacterized protein TREMEDRAFT_73506 [Tremella mesenterica DSM 1558]EIW70561.1 hypothetical protein TREMEDRAFT_73506 [Tremella mesenterica DSM 1558]RXK38246.1 hypothetical protein M231_04418 [Tremella mesenterica]